MSDLLIAAMDFIGFIGFSIAIVFSYKNFLKTRAVSLLWLIFTIAMIFLAVFMLFNFLEWVGYYPDFFDAVENSLFPVAIVSLFTVVLISHEEFLKPVTK